MAESADELARRHAATARRGRPERVTLRELRDALGRQSLSAATRLELAEALSRAGLEARPPLLGLELDDVIELRPAAGLPLRAARGAWRVATRTETLLGLALAVVVVVGAVAGLFGSPSSPRPMTGDFNVLVAPFDARGSASERDGQALADTTARALRAGLRRAHPTGRNGLRLDAQVRGPAGVGPVSGLARSSRAAQAARLARAHDADVVVFGAVTAGAHASRAMPGVYVRAAKLPDADELAGLYRLATVVEPAGSVNDAIARRQQLRVAFLRRVDGLRELVAGLADFQARDWASARRRFAAAAATDPGAPTTAFMRLFEGNAAGKQRDLAGADRAYRRALAAQPTLLRAAVGRAEVLFQRAHGGCRARTASAAGLRRASRAYEGVLARVRDDAPLVVALRAHFGLGRVLMCASQAELAAEWDAAEQELRRTLALARRADPARFRDERAESHAGLGLIALPPVDGDLRARRDAYERALGHYEQALSISDDPARQAVYLDMMAFVQGRLGDRTAAARAKARARALARPVGGSGGP